MVAGLVVAHYSESHDFNGIPFRELVRTVGCSPGDLVDVLSGLIRERRISIVFPDHDVKPHIKRRPDEPIENQVAKLTTEKLPWRCFFATSQTSVPSIRRYGRHVR